MQRQQASPLSALISTGLLLTTAGLGAAFLFLARYYEKPWILPPSMLVLAAIGFFVYIRSLASMDELLADNRDTLSETLAKA